MSNFKTKFCWWPVRLAQHIENAPSDKPNMRFIGWVWMQKVYLTNNHHHGWIAFLDSKPIDIRCKKCGQMIINNNST